MPALALDVLQSGLVKVFITRVYRKNELQHLRLFIDQSRIKLLAAISELWSLE